MSWTTSEADYVDDVAAHDADDCEDSQETTLRCEFLTETDDAVKVRLLSNGKEYWMPFSQVISSVRKHEDEGTYGAITITSWLASKKGL